MLRALATHWLRCGNQGSQQPVPDCNRSPEDDVAFLQSPPRFMRGAMKQDEANVVGPNRWLK